MSNTPNPKRKPLSKTRIVQREMERRGLRLARLGVRAITRNGSMPASSYEETRVLNPDLALPAFADLTVL